MKHFSQSNVRRMVRLVSMMLLGMLCLTPGAQIARAESSGPRYYNSVDSISTSHADWMKWVPDDFTLAQMSIPGTHDTLTYNLPYVSVARTQGLPLATQLEAGIRAIDLRAKHGNNTFLMYHGPVYLDMEFGKHALTPMVEFLKAHPDETILMHLAWEDQEDLGGNTRTFAETFKAYRDHPDYQSYFWKPSSTDPAIPRLGEVRGKIVLLRNFKPIGGEEYGLPWNDNPKIDIQNDYWYGSAWLKWSNAVAPQFDDAQNHEPDCAPPIGNASDNTNCKLFINHTSTSGGGSPAYLAGGRAGIRGVNDYTLEFLFERSALRRTGVVMMDFPGAGLIDAIIAHNLPYTTNISDATADFAYIAQNIAHSAVRGVYDDLTDDAQGRYNALKRFFTLFVPSSQSVSVVVWNTGSAYFVVNYDGWYGYESDVYGYSNLVFTNRSKADTIRGDEIASVVDPIINSFDNQDTLGRAVPIYDALSGHWPAHRWLVVVHQDPSDSNWAVDPVGSVYSSRVNGYGYEIRGVPLATAPTITPQIAPAAPNGQNDWYTTGDVNVTWTINDNGLAITSKNGCDPAAITSDTMGTTLTCSATNAEGTTEQSVTIKRDATKPDTEITKGPKKKTKKAKAKFRFKSDEQSAKFECSLDGAKFKSCDSPEKFKVDPGKHKLAVRAVDQAGNQDGSADKYSWKRKRKRH